MEKMVIEYAPISELKEWGDNPRHHNVEAIRRSMERFGIRWPIIVNRNTMQVEAGHGRLKALRELGETEVPVLFVEDDDLTAKAFAIADNRTQELTRWDEQGLVDILSELEAQGNLEDSAFNRDDLGQLLRDLEMQQAPVHEPPIFDNTETRTQRGDIWELGRHRLMCGDACHPQDVLNLLDGRKIDCIFTDPPYGLAYDSAALQRSQRDWGAIAGDDLDEQGMFDFSKAWLGNFRAHGQPYLSFYICFAITKGSILERAMESLGIYMAVPLIWVKTMGAVHWYRYHPRHEVIYYAGEGAKPTGPTSRWFGPNNETTVWEVPHETSNQKRLHPTQKPIALVERAFHNSTRPGDIVSDPFVGSGTSIIAAERKAVDCYAMEIMPRICDVAIARWEAFTGGQAVKVGEREMAYA